MVINQTELSDLLITQVGIFGDASRSFSEEYKSLSNEGLPEDLVEWLSQRFVTIAFYSILDDRETFSKVEDPFYRRLQWLPIKELDKLHLDHKAIVEKALQKLSSDALAEPILKELLPAQFTMPTLHALYEAILGRSIDRGNFRQRILKSKIINKIGVQKKQTHGRPADIYTFNEEIYYSSLSAAQKFGF